MEALEGHVVEVVVGRLVELELLVDVDVEVEVVVGRLVELELLVDVDVDVEVGVGRLVELELLVDVVDDVVVVVWGLAAKAGTARTSASRTLPRTFPPRLTIYRLISCSREFAGRVVVRGSKGCAEQVGAAPRKARTPISPPPPPSPEPPGPQRLWAFTARTGYGQCDHRPIASIGNRDHSVRAP